MDKIKDIVKKVIPAEVIILFTLLLLINFFLIQEEKVIKADGKGYYDYLPGIFIYEDISFDYYTKVDLKYYSHGESNGLIKDFKGKKISKYPIGMAVLVSPFFAYSHYVVKTSNEFPPNGYSLPYQKGVFYAALFYLFLGLVFLRKLLLFYDLSRIKIFIVQAFLVFGTPLIHYTYYDPSFSHVYSFFAITLFFYLFKHYITNNKIKTLFIAGLVFGLIFLLRQVNIIAILFVPFLIGDFNRFKIFIVKHFYLKPLRVLLFSLGFIIVAFIQLTFNKLQSGYFFAYSYGEEGFNFLDPQFFKSLFGFGKGFFVYTPIAFVGVLGVLFFNIKSKKWFLIISYILFIAFVNYIFSSWWCWNYGGSFSLRPWVDFLSVFAIGLLFMISTKHVKFLLIPLSVFFIYVNIIQTYQYKKYILDFGILSYEKYKKVFLHTEKRYEGYFFRRTFDINDFKIINEVVKTENEVIKTNSSTIISSFNAPIDQYDKLKLIRVWLPNNLLGEDLKTYLTIKSTNNDVVYHHSQYYFHQFEAKDIESDMVYFNYEFQEGLFNKYKKLYFEIGIESVKQEEIVSSSKIEFYNLRYD
jgi:hypothetical protein